MKKIVGKDKFYTLIEELGGKSEIIGPVDVPNKGIFYQPIINTADLYLREGFTVEPIKKSFLPPSEELFSFDGDVLTEQQITNNKQRIIIGVRPCEIRGLTLLDKVFNSEYKDEFYINNRRRTIIVGLACNKPDRNCFCVSMGGSPVETRGMDALLFGIKDGFIVELITDKGREVFGSLGEELNEDQKKSLKVSKEEIEGSIKKKLKIPETLDSIFENSYWDEVSRPCISCGICTYLCPTCHCFDLVDEERKRLRCYDGCAFPDFTLQASGENPRPTKRERYRQRIFHKFDYFKKNFGENLCVGCGRCIRYCPVKMDIADVVNKIPGTSKQ